MIRVLIADDQELVRTGFLGGGGLRRAEEARARPVDPTVVRSLVGDSARASRLDALSGRERQVLALAAEGHTNARIAAELGYS